MIKMVDSLTVLYIGYLVSILLHFIAGIITAAFIIPLQAKQANVKNGLIKLRQQMLLKGSLTLIIIVVSIAALSIRYFISDLDILRYAVVALIGVHGIGALLLTIVEYQVYHTQYSVENKLLHQRIDEIEIADQVEADSRR